MKIRTLFGESGEDSFPYASWLIQSLAAPAVAAAATLFSLAPLPQSYEEAMIVPAGYLFAVLYGAVFAGALSWLRRKRQSNHIYPKLSRGDGLGEWKQGRRKRSGFGTSWK